MDTRRTTEHTLRKGMAYSESSAGGQRKMLLLLLLLVRSWRNDQDDDDDGVCTLREKGRRRFLGVARFLVVPHRRRTAQYPVQGDNDSEKESHTRIWGAKAGINQGLVVQMKLITLIWTVTFTQPNPCVIRNERSCCCCCC